MRKKMLSSATAPDATRTAAQTLESLMTQDNATGGDRWLDSSWKGAEAYHFMLLAHRQLYNGLHKEAMRTAVRLKDYETVLPPAEIYSLLCLSSFYAKFYGQTSKALIKLQAMEKLPQVKRDKFDELALAIFTKQSPHDPAARKGSCHACGEKVDEWETRCPSCNQAFYPCVFSGRPILDPAEAAKCKACKHRYYKTEARSAANCALCHTPLPGYSGIPSLH